MNKVEIVIVQKGIRELDIRKTVQIQLLIALCKLSAISKAIGVTMDFFVSQEIGVQEDLSGSFRSEEFISSSPGRECYKGVPHFYYLSLTIREGKILYGKLDIRQEGCFFAPRKVLGTGETNCRGGRIRREDFGHLLVSTAVKTAYYISKSDVVGKLCMIGFRDKSRSMIHRKSPKAYRRQLPRGTSVDSAL